MCVKETVFPWCVFCKYFLASLLLMSSLYICFSSVVWLNLIAVLWFLGFRSYEHVLYTFLRKIISAFFPNIVTDVATTFRYPVLEFRVWQEAGTSPQTRVILLNAIF